MYIRRTNAIASTYRNIISQVMEKINMLIITKTTKKALIHYISQTYFNCASLHYDISIAVHLVDEERTMHEYTKPASTV